MASLWVAGLLAAACSTGESALDAGNDEPSATTSGAVSEPPPESSTAAANDVTEGDGDPPSIDAPSPTSAPVDESLPTTTMEPVDLVPCPVGALDGSADQPVEITFWHGLGNELEEALIEIVDAYNEGQDRVTVDLQNQISYESIADKYIQGSAATRPDVVQLPEYTVQSFAQSGTFVPVESCVESSGYDMSTLLPGALNAYLFGGVQWALPFNVSGPVLYFNRAMFGAAGLDPDDPPVSLEELRSAAAAVVDAGVADVGIALDSGRDAGGSWYLEQWLARAGQPYADNDNGRTAPATRVLFNNEVAVELLTEVQDLVNDGLAVSVGDNAGGADAFLKMIDEQAPAAMTISTAAALSTVLNLLAGGFAEGFGPDDVGVGPMPGPGSTPSVQVGGASLWMPAGKSDATTAAAWDFIMYLVDAQTQSTWAAATGYVPVHLDAPDLEPLQTTYASDPRFRVAYDQLVATDADLVAAPPALGPQREVRAQTADAVAAIYAGADVATVLADAEQSANALIENYNARN